jgi:hypothetical protein
MKKSYTSARPRSAVTSPHGRNNNVLHHRGSKTSNFPPGSASDLNDRFASTKSSNADPLEKRRKSMQQVEAKMTDIYTTSNKVQQYTQLNNLK